MRAPTRAMSSSSRARLFLVVLGLAAILVAGVVANAFGQAAASVTAGLFLALLLDLASTSRSDRR
jgi:hypothetical protein